MTKTNPSFFKQDVLDVAPAILGKYIVRQFENGEIRKFRITEVEAYRGEEDLACHASKGRTDRTEVMYWEGGYIYVYLIYGIHYMLNFVTGQKNNPQAILIRGVDGIIGPGRVTKQLQINKGLNKTNLLNSNEIWIEDGEPQNYKTSTRIGIDYSGEFWKNRPWRFIME